MTIEYQVSAYVRVVSNTDGHHILQTKVGWNGEWKLRNICGSLEHALYVAEYIAETEDETYRSNPALMEQ